MPAKKGYNAVSYVVESKQQYLNAMLLSYFQEWNNFQSSLEHDEFHYIENRFEFKPQANSQYKDKT